MLLEDACHQLYLSASLQGSDCGPSYERYSAALSNLTNVKDKQLQLQNELNVLEQIITFTAVTAANATTNPLFNNLASTVASMKGKEETCKCYIINTMSNHMVAIHTGRGDQST